MGSNLGQKEEHIRQAITLIAEHVGQISRQSELFYSEPWGFQSDNAFVNAVVCVETQLTPHGLLRATQRIERKMGKTAAHATERQKDNGQTTPVYHDRPIDIDILLYDDISISEPDLTIPHPLMHERPFVMEPLRQVLTQEES